METSFILLLHQVSLVLRGANDYMLDEMERALHDALCIVKRTLESNTVSHTFVEASVALYVYLCGCTSDIRISCLFLMSYISNGVGACMSVRIVIILLRPCLAHWDFAEQV